MLDADDADYGDDDMVMVVIMVMMMMMVVIIGWRGGGRPGALPSPLSGWTRAIIERRRSPTDNIIKD